MTDREFNDARARIRKVANEWITHLGFRWWTVDLLFPRDAEGTLHSRHVGEDWEGLMCVRTKWEYQQVSIEFNMPPCSQLSDADLKDHFVHELSHAMVSEMREWTDYRGQDAEYDACVRHEERVVCHMTKAFGWVYDAGFRAGEKKAKVKPKEPLELTSPTAS